MQPRTPRLAIALAFLLASIGLAPAQSMTGGGTGGSTGGGSTGGGSTGGSGGSSSPQLQSGTRVGQTSGGTPFSGGQPQNFANQGTQGLNTAPAAGGGSNTTAVIPSKSNPWLATYNNPYAIGQRIQGATAGQTTTPKAFGQAMFGTATTTTTLTGNNQSNAGTGFNTMNVKKAPHYYTALARDFPIAVRPAPVVQQRLQTILLSSSRLPSRANMQVQVEGSVVVLRGMAASEDERDLAERVLRLEPGVIAVDNRVTVPGQP